MQMQMSVDSSVKALIVKGRRQKAENGECDSPVLFHNHDQNHIQYAHRYSSDIQNLAIPMLTLSCQPLSLFLLFVTDEKRKRHTQPQQVSAA